MLDLLTHLPWWVSVAVAGIVYFGLSVIVPGFLCTGESCPAISAQLAATIQSFAPVAFIFLLPAPIAAIRAWKNRRLLDQQRGITSIRLLDWKQFESLLAEYYRRKKFRVRENLGGGADGGVDLWLDSDDGLYLVQCKQWRSQKVSVRIVRELYGVMAAEGAYGGAVVTSGAFTTDAEAFARGKPIDLIDGTKLKNMIAEIQQAGGAHQRQLSARSDDGDLDCPRCGAPLVLRTAKRGRKAGSQFYGCSTYPACRYIRDEQRPSRAYT